MVFVIDPSRVHCRTQSQIEKRKLVDPFVNLPVPQQVVLSQKAAAPLVILGGNVAPEPKIVVALQSKNEQLVKGQAAVSASGAKLTR